MGRYNPLHWCPPQYRERYERTGKLAQDGSPLKAVKLKCLDCCGWEYREAKACQTAACPLWQLNRRIFGGGR